MTKHKQNVVQLAMTNTHDGLNMDAIYVARRPLWPDGHRKSTGNAFCWREPRQVVVQTKKAYLGQITT